jgi:nicotinate-nucleotide--dimethylbenzimidazole phosphoribosyltransferase
MSVPKLSIATISFPNVTLAPLASASPLFERSKILTLPSGALSSLIDPVLKITAANQSIQLNAEAYLFAGDHAVAHANQVSAYPPEITSLMVTNFLNGGAAMSVLCKLRKCPLYVLDVGVRPLPAGTAQPVVLPKDKTVKFEDWSVPKTHSKSYPHGAQNIVDNSAILEDHFVELFQKARTWAFNRVKTAKLNAIILGEMGIGNTTPASALACWAFGFDPANAVGTGTGINADQKSKKVACVKAALNRHNNAHPKKTNPWHDALQAICSLGGFELAGMAGAFVGAAEAGSFIILDGLICTSAIAPLVLAVPGLKEWCVAGHQSSEPAHKFMLEKLGLDPLLNLNLRLGEGSGAALCLGLLQDANELINQMSTFADLIPTK